MKRRPITPPRGKLPPRRPAATPRDVMRRLPCIAHDLGNACFGLLQAIDNANGDVRKADRAAFEMFLFTLGRADAWVMSGGVFNVRKRPSPARKR